MRGRKGAVLLLTLFFLAMMAFLAVASTQLLPTQLTSATRELNDTQGSYACDAAIQDVLKQLQANPNAAITTSSLSFANGWTGAIVSVQGPITYNGKKLLWLTAEARQNNLLRRQARAVVEAGVPSLTKFAYFFAMNSTGNGQAAWDYTLRVKGDVYWNSVFKMRDFVRSDSPTSWLPGSPNPYANIQGRVFATGFESGSYDGVNYTSEKPYDTSPAGPAPAASPYNNQYNKIFRDGAAGVQANAAPVPFDAAQAGTDIGAGAWSGGGALSGITPSANGLYVPYQAATNNTAGGVVVKGDVANITLQVTNTTGGTVPNVNVGATAVGAHSMTTGNVITSNTPPTVAGGYPTQKLQFSGAVNGPSLLGNSTLPTSDTWYVTEVGNFTGSDAVGDGAAGLTLAGNLSGFTINGVANGTGTAALSVAPGNKRTVIYNKEKTAFFSFNNVTNGATFVKGAVGTAGTSGTGVSGVNKGKHTVWSESDMAIGGELLKSCLTRGASCGETDPDVLGVGKNTANSANEQLNIRLTTNPHPADGFADDNKFYVYSAIGALGKAALESGGPGNSALWSGADLYMNGSLIHDSANPSNGHVARFFDFFDNFDATMILDPTAAVNPPPFWPGGGVGSKPTLKAYVEVPVGHQSRL